MRSNVQMGLSALAVATLLSTSAVLPAAAQSVPAANSKSNDGRDPAVAQRSFETGVSAYQAGRHDAAISSLNAAIQAGGLAGPAMARALYFRGAAFQAKGMHGQAISDLTSALWFKGGLSETERTDATRLRGEAYRSAGLTEQGTTSAGAAGNSPATIAPSANSASSWTASAAPISGGPTDPTAGPQLSALPTDTSSPTTGGLGNIGTVIGGLFGGLTGGAKPVETAAIPSAANPTPSGGPEILPWGAVARPATTIEPVVTAAPDTQVPAQSGQAKSASGKATTAKPTAQKPKAEKQAAAPSNAGGSYRIQVGTVKSMNEANVLAARLKSEAALSGAAVSIDQTAFGGVTFYSVRVGPYASTAETKAPCAALKQGGLDCLVTTQ